MQDIGDYGEINLVVARYALLIDSGNPDRLVSDVFTEDTVLDYGTGEITGEETIRQFFAGATTLAGSMHFVSNFSICIDGDLSSSLCYYQAWHWFAKDGEDKLPAVDLVTVGCYDDHLVRTDVGWPIRRRTLRPLAPGPVGFGTPPDYLRQMLEQRADQPGMRTPGSPPLAAQPRPGTALR